MIPFGSDGPSAGAGGGPPPPPPLPSSSSILSPLAPPFTVDRRYVAFRQPMSDASGWPSSSAASAATSSRLSSLAIGLCSMPTSSVFEFATPYYPSYASVGGGLPGSGDDRLKPLIGFERFGEVDSGPWSGPFLGEERGKEKGFDSSSSWMDPSSSYCASSFCEGGSAEGLMACEDVSLVQRGNNATSLSRNLHFGLESSGWLGDKHATVYKENPAAPFDESGSVLLGPSPLFDKLSYSQPQGPTSMMKTCETFNLNSTNNYTAQLASCSANPIFYNPATACSASTPIYDPSADRTISSMDSVLSENVYSTIQHANPCRIDFDYFDYISSKQKEPMPIKEPTIGQITEEGTKEWSIATGNMKGKFGVSVTSSPIRNDFSVDREQLIGNLLDCSSEANYGLKSAQLNFTNSFASGNSSVEPDNSVQTPSDLLDQHNLAVDSPCWKGASSTRQYPFGTGDKADGYPEVKKLKGRNGWDQGQKHLLAKYVGAPSSEDVESSICRENQKGSSLSYPRELSMVGLPCMHQKFEDAKGECSGFAEAGFDNGSQAVNNLEEKNYEATQFLNTDPGLKDHELKQLSKEEGVSSANHNATISGMTNPEMDAKAVGQDCSSDLSPCARDHIMKLSAGVAVPSKSVEQLGSSDPTGLCSPQGKDPEPLVKAMHGLSQALFSHHDRYANELKEHDQELLCQVIDNLKACLVKNRKNIPKETSNVFGIEAAASEVEGPKTSDGLKTSNNKGGKDMKHRIHYSGLGVDNNKFNNFGSEGFDTDCRTRMAQALHKVSKEGCDQEEDPQTLLYKNLWIEAEVALCSMKYELARMKLEMENDKCHQKAKSHDLSDMEWKPSQLTKLRSCLNGTDGPRYKVEENSCNTSTQQADGGTNSNMDPHEVKTNWVDETDASVLASFRVQKGCSDHLKCGNMEGHPKILNSASIGGCVGTKAVCSPHLDGENVAGLNYLPVKLDLGFSQQNQESRIPDEPSIYLEPHEVNTDQTDEVDSSVMARLRIFEGRGDISNSLSTEYPVKLETLDARGCMETKETACNINLDSENGTAVKYLPAKLTDLSFLQPNLESYTADELNSCWKPHEIKMKPADEVDCSIMARLSILKGRIDNSSSNTLGELPKLVDSVDVEGCLERKDSLCSFHIGGENAASENFVPTKLAGLSFMQKNEQPSTENEPSKSSSGLECSSNVQQVGANSSDATDLDPNNNSESKARESPVCTVNDLVTQSASPSSEWEHVLKDELTWYSSS